MLVIRFLRKGKKNQPFFKIVVTDKKNPPRGGRFLETVGFFNPLTKEKALKKERVEHWLKVGAQPSDRVYNLLIAEQIIKGKKKAVHAKTKKQPSTAEPTIAGQAIAEPNKEIKKEEIKEEVKEEVKEEESSLKNETLKTEANNNESPIKIEQ
ncbi:30S ribosomal protein S16 [Patescibacteria group bacterium]|nr:30S ribosomal protein S16 [Patescibacteria group bacterium]